MRPGGDERAPCSMGMVQSHRETPRKATLGLPARRRDPGRNRPNEIGAPRARGPVRRRPHNGARAPRGKAKPCRKLKGKIPPRLSEIPGGPPPRTHTMILAKTEQWLALDKPAGVSMATSTRPGRSGAEAVRRLLEACGERPDRISPGPSIRSGLPASFARQDCRGSSGALEGVPVGPGPQDVPCAGLGPSTARREQDRHSARPRPHGRAQDEDRRRRQARGHGVPHAHPAPVGVRPGFDPATGRTHQIRVHLSALGHPIVGDDLYGGATRWRGVRIPAHRRMLRAVVRPLLHAERIEIPEMAIDVRSPLPEDYERVLAALASDSRNDWFAVSDAAQSCGADSWQSDWNQTVARREPALEPKKRSLRGREAGR